MPRLVALVLLAAALGACGGPSAPIEPPDGWTGTADRWWVPGTDTSAAFRDLSTLGAMGVEVSGDPYVAYVQEQLLPVYRANPELADSVFRAQFLPDLRRPADDAEATRVSQSVQREFFQRFNGARKMTQGGLAVPDSLATVRGEAEVQIYVGPDRRPLGVKLVRATGTALDRLVLRDAATSEYSDGWVRPRAGQAAGVNVPTWVRVTHRFGE